MGSVKGPRAPPQDGAAMAVKGLASDANDKLTGKSHEDTYDALCLLYVTEVEKAGRKAGEEEAAHWLSEQARREAWETHAEAVPAAITAALNSVDASQRAAAVAELVQIGNIAAFELLTNCFDDDYRNLRSAHALYGLNNRTPSCSAAFDEERPSAAETSAPGLPRALLIVSSPCR